MNILDKLVKFLDENFEELKKAVYENEYLGMIDKWYLEPEDKKCFAKYRPVIEGPQHRLKYILWSMEHSLKDDIIAFKNDKRTREEKYSDSLKQALELEKIWNI